MKRRTKGLGLVTVGALVLLLALAMVGVAGANNVQCDGADQQGGDAPSGNVVTAVWIFSGGECFPDDTSGWGDGQHGTDADGAACYEVDGVGTGSARVRKIGRGEGRVCQEISHIEIAYEAIPTLPPPPTPSASVNFRFDCLEDGRAVVYWTFDAGARGRTLVVTGQGSEHELQHGQGRFLARPGAYTWIVYQDETPIARGGFTVEPCPEPTEIPPDEPSLRIGGRCTEGGDSQEIGYVFSDGDFDGAKLRITRSDGVVVLEGADEGTAFFPARAGDYSWEIIWFNGQTREVLDFGDFSVAKCDKDDPTPTPTDTPTVTPTPTDGPTPTPTEEQGCWNTGDNICPGDETPTPTPPGSPGTGAGDDPINFGLIVFAGVAGVMAIAAGAGTLMRRSR